jgi:hypothetical protein
MSGTEQLYTLVAQRQREERQRASGRRRWLPVRTPRDDPTPGRHRP